MALPLVKATCTAVSDAYSAAKGRHPLLGSACRLAEHCVCSLTTSALDHAQPLLSHLQPQRESPWPEGPVVAYGFTLSCAIRMAWPEVWTP